MLDFSGSPAYYPYEDVCFPKICILKIYFDSLLRYLWHLPHYLRGLYPGLAWGLP